MWDGIWDALIALVVVIAAVWYALRLRAQSELREVENQQYLDGLSELLDSARHFALAAQESASAVRSTIDNAIRKRFPEIDSVAIFSQEFGRLICVYSTPDGRLARYAGRAEYVVGEEHAEVLPVVALRAAATTMSGPKVKGIHPGCKFAAAVPLTLDHGNTSIVYLSSGSRTFHNAMPVIETLLEQAEPALVLADAREDSESRATYDPLTGLLQRGSFDLRLRDEIDRSEDVGASLALLYIDLDNFKKWNDTFGHHSGDLLLQRVAQILNDNRESAHDLVGRRGGDEFVMVLPDADKSQAIACAKSIGAAIAFDDRRGMIPAEKQSLDPLPISASIGVAALPRDAGSASDLLLRADKIMYQAKELGRDRVCYIGDDGEFHDEKSSESDRRDRSTRPFADRRRTGSRSFANASEAAG